MNNIEIKKLSQKIRIQTLKMTNKGMSSHIGSVFSIADIISVLYGRVLHYDPKNPKISTRDRFILSKGHAGAAVYAALSESGFFPKSDLSTYYQNGSNLSGHVSHKNVPGVEVSTGSLGHGLSLASGMALAAKLENLKHKVFVLMSDGECDEGSTWEALMFASHHNLKNLIAIIDRNNLQSILSTEDTLQLEPFAKKWEAFNWIVKVVDGHNHDEITKALQHRDNSEEKPTVIIANTIKGKGVSFMEDSVLWHYRSAQNDEFKAALKELENTYNSL